MRLFPQEKFAEIFEPLKGLHIGVVDGDGNTGDRLIYLATRQLLDDFEVSYHTFNPLADSRKYASQFERLLIFGGGSMGATYKPTREIRNAALATGIPCDLLPQSYTMPEPGGFHRVFVREKKSQEICPQGILMPDMAMGYDYPDVPPPDWNHGLFLQIAGGSIFHHIEHKNDPAHYCFTPMEYIRHVGKHKRIVTDRCHITIIALALGRSVTLLPNDYHKNRSMYDTWFKDLGCLWADHV